MEETLYRAYVKILEEELIPAMGCTEPIAVAYAGALARQTLGELPRSVDVQVSANIIKNVKSVVVPHTGGLRGIAAAAAAGPPVPVLRPAPPVCSHPAVRAAPFFARRGGERALFAPFS